MSIIRQDLASKDWTIFSTERAKRPFDYKKEEKKQVKKEYLKNCPFCRGNEHMTPKEIYSIRQGNDWKVRVIPNKFPALQAKELIKATTERHIKEPYLYMDGIGSHEVIIESPKHNDSLPIMKIEQVDRVIQAYRQRFINLSKSEDYQLIIIFRNNGKIAGSSLEHPHSQLVATPFVPSYVRTKLYEAQRYFDDFGTCVYCDMIKYELKNRERLIYENDNFIAFAPFASIVPYNIIIIPKKHMSCFLELPENETRSFAHSLKIVLSKLYYLLNDPDYNYVIDSTPPDKSGERHYHWHLEILPRLTTRAGFEIGSGVYINTIMPETCARLLRDCKI
jgi:UDPglucose--hexose-1-phosphate uridylyltransferase